MPRYRNVPTVGPRRLTPLEAEALEVVRRHGSLVQLEGGFWSFPAVTLRGGHPAWWVSSGLVSGLVARGLLRWVTDRKVEGVEQDGR